MEAVSRWLCGFYADKVTIQHHSRTVTCGENVLLCSIALTDTNSKFTDYHENKITVLYHGGNAEAVGDCKLYITKVNYRQLNVFCYARRAGRATVKVDLGKWYQVEDQDLNIDIVPSTPHYLNDVRFTTHGAIDERFSADPTVMYRNQWSILEAEMVDRYDNVIRELSNDYNIGLQLSNDNGNVMEMEYQDVEFQNERLRVQVKINEAGKHNVAITLTNRNNHDQVIRLQEIQIQVNDAPLHLAGSKFLHPETCVAGKEIQLEVFPFDVFGCPLPATSTTDCNLTGDILNLPLKLSKNNETTDFKITKQNSKETHSIFVRRPPSKTAIKGNKKEQVNIRKIDTPGNLSFTVTVCFRIAGLRKLRLTVHSGSKSSSKDIYVNVLPSTPHYVNDVRFTTHGAIDESFSADPIVMYRNQWSILEAEMVDRYDNVVRELSNDYNIGLQLSNDVGKEMEYKDVEFRNERLRVQVKINEAGKHNLAITLTNRNSYDQEVVRLQEIQIQVNDTPLYLAGSTFFHPETCLAGKNIQLEIRPLDVFGCALPADSTTDCNLTGDFLNLALELNESKETMDFRRLKNESNVVIRVSIVLTKAGRRKVRIIDKDNKSKELSIQVNPDVNDVHWELTAPKQTAYRREKLILSKRLFDCFNNEVRTDALENIPQLIKRNGPDGLNYTEESNNKVAIRCYFKQTGKYDLCLADRGGTCLEGTSFLITVQDAPLDYHSSTIEWIPQYDDIPDQPVFPEDETFQCCLRLKDVVGYDYDTKIAKGCIKVKYGNTEMKNIKVSSCPNDVGSYNIVVPLKNLVKDDASPRFWCFVNGKKIEQPLILPTFEGFEKYDDDRNCVVQHRRYEFVRIVCYGVKRNDIIGSDYAHLNNIKRVCELYDDPEVETCQDEGIDDDFAEYDDDEPIGAGGGGSDDYDYGYDYDANDYDNYDNDDDDDDDGGDDDDPTTIIELPLEEIVCEIESWDWIIICTLEEIEDKIQDCRNILLHLLRAIFYRKEAFELDKDREDWKERASESYRKIERGENINKNLPRFCSQIKEKYARLMRRYHDSACEEFFQFFNAKRDQSEIDLHGLLVVDEKKLRDYERQLRSRGRMSLDQVERKIEEERDHGNEAIRKLRERLDNYDKKKAKEEGEPWLEIIVGSGHHSKVRQNSKVRQRIRPKVEEYLKKRKKTRKFSPVNKGALVVTFEKYTGSEPCFGEYYCTKCDNRWRNGRSWIGKWQACYDCHEKKGLLEKCYPLKQRCRRKRQSYNPNIVSRNQRPIPEHLEKLCEKCIELGRPCPRA